MTSAGGTTGAKPGGGPACAGVAVAVAVAEGAADEVVLERSGSSTGSESRASEPSKLAAISGSEGIVSAAAALSLAALSMRPSRRSA
jgi:hypothetical protein